MMKHIVMNMNRLPYLVVVILVQTIFPMKNVHALEAIGMIKGEFFENAAPCSLRINIHNAVNGLYFGKTETDLSGSYSFSDMPFGQYYLITHPAGVGVRMPMQWRTENLELNPESPIYTVQQVDGFAVETIFPGDGEKINLENIAPDNQLTFQWKPYSDSADYEIEIYSTDKVQQFHSGRIDKEYFSFNGIFEDGSNFQRRLYRWKLKTFPKGSEWIGTSKPQDIVIDDLGDINIYEGEYIQLEFPKWYEATIKSLDMIHLLDQCYLLEKELMANQVPSLGPLPGEKQSFLYDTNITFAYSGNPIHFGKNHIIENSFPFFVAFHEMGHNFQLGGLPGFAHLLGGEYYSKTAIYNGFCEGFATLASLYITETIDKDSLETSVRLLFEEENRSMREKFVTALRYYEDKGPDRERVTPDVIDGMFIRLGDKYGWKIFPKLFYVFKQNELTDQIYELAGDNDRKRVTILIAALSVATGDDLREEFMNWDFPMHKRYYRRILPLVTKCLSEN